MASSTSNPTTTAFANAPPTSASSTSFAPLPAHAHIHHVSTSIPPLSRTPSLGGTRSAEPHPSFSSSQPVRVSILGHDSYIIGYNLAQYAAKETVKLFSGESGRASSFIVLTDRVLQKLHLPPLLAALQQAIDEQYPNPNEDKPRLLSYAIATGEANKTRERKAEVEDWMLGMGCTRDSVLLCLGGGVVGDLGGELRETRRCRVERGKVLLGFDG